MSEFGQPLGAACSNVFSPTLARWPSAGIQVGAGPSHPPKMVLPLAALYALLVTATMIYAGSPYSESQLGMFTVFEPFAVSACDVQVVTSSSLLLAASNSAM